MKTSAGCGYTSSEIERGIGSERRDQERQRDKTVIVGTRQNCFRRHYKHHKLMPFLTVGRQSKSGSKPVPLLRPWPRKPAIGVAGDRPSKGSVSIRVFQYYVVKG
jgi:hypothetical protein